MTEEHGVSERQACKALRVPRSSYQYEPKAKNDTPVINELQEVVSKHPAIGFWQSYFRLRRKGFIECILLCILISEEDSRSAYRQE
jgi:putative transposase